MPYQPPFEITTYILSQVAEICEQVGRLEGGAWGERTPYLRKDNRIASIHGSLAIENNTLSLDQVADVIAGKKVHGLAREIQEVKNAFAAYEALPDFQAKNPTHLLKAHALMLHNIAKDAGQFRAKGVGIYRGSQLVHMAPPADRVPQLIRQLLDWLAQTDVHPLIASAIIHYELEFIHPFSDGNGRIGRLWQTLILSNWNSRLAALPVETVIHHEQAAYYQALAAADKKAEATPFIEFILGAIITMIRAEFNRNPSPETDQVSDYVSDQVKTLLQALKNSHPASADTLIHALKIKHRPTFRKNYLNPSLKAGFIVMTQPNSPRSPTQKYHLTQEGIKKLTQL